MRTKPMTHRFNAWAIDTCSDEGHGYIGRYWHRIPLPVHMEGCEIALFKTRELAKAAVKDMNEHDYVQFPKAKVARVFVSIVTTGR